ncbi:MAG: SEC-C metal-binding domain-containing protein [Elusimicrobiota bacterium]|jgi:hypothetical protein
MSWLKSLLKPFVKTEEAPAPTLEKEKPAGKPPKEKKAPTPKADKPAVKAPEATPEPKKEEPKVPDEKGMMSFFYRKWKDPAFLKQVKILSQHMMAQGVDIKSQDAVKAWLEKNKEAVEAGKFNEPPAEGAKPQTYEKTGPEIGRNDPCPCGSGKKYKKCCATKA